jgi:hypothetical protein
VWQENETSKIGAMGYGKGVPVENWNLLQIHDRMQITEDCSVKLKALRQVLSYCEPMCFVLRAPI